jgi:hypothetical protein
MLLEEPYTGFLFHCSPTLLYSFIGSQNAVHWNVSRTAWLSARQPPQIALPFILRMLWIVVGGGWKFHEF